MFRYENGISKGPNGYGIASIDAVWADPRLESLENKHTPMSQPKAEIKRMVAEGALVASGSYSFHPL